CSDPAFPVACRAAGRHAAGCFPAAETCTDIATWCSDPMLIDDLEDGDAFICPSSGRRGEWSVIASGDGLGVTPSADTPFTPTLIRGGRVHYVPDQTRPIE